MDRKQEPPVAATADLNRRNLIALAGGAAASGTINPGWMAMAADNRVSDIVMMNAGELARAIRMKQVSCVEVMNAYLDHIERLNPRVNAIVSLQNRDGLLDQARQRDQAIAHGGGVGPLHGIPQAIKDLTPVKGIRTTQGSPLFANFVPQADAIYVERIKRAGAIIIGKTNVPEFGLGSQTYNPVFGATRNAYDQSKTAGGSTGGGAVALALRMLPVCDGTDHGGSLRNPGAYNNVFGLRPSFGRVPAETVDVFDASLSVVGPMARTVPDLAMLLSVQAGYDARAPLSNHEDPAAFANLMKRDVKGLRLAWVDYSGAIPFEPGVVELCKTALKTFEELGCVVEEAKPDHPIEPIFPNWVKLRAWQAGNPLRMLYADPRKRALLNEQAHFEVETLLGLTTQELIDAMAVRTAWYQSVRRLLERYDAMVLPSSQLFPFPVTTHWPTQIAGKRMDTYHRWMEIMIPVTMSGCPAVNVPAGFNAIGLPMGLQIAGRNHGELACLQLAHAYDEASGWVEKRKPALLGA